MVINTSGQVIYSTETNPGTVKLEMDASKFGANQSGLKVYFVRIETQMGTRTASIVIQP